MCAALLTSYWDFWEQSVSYQNFREDRIALGLDVERILIAGGVDVSYTALIDSEIKGSEVGGHIADNPVDVIVVVQSLCAPPTFMQAALEKISDTPLVIWAVQRTNFIDSEVNAEHITANGATVGAPMLTNLLCRQSRPFELNVGVISNADHLEKFTKTVRAAAISAQLRRARVGRVGHPIAGYTCVDADGESVRKATGIEFVNIQPKVLRDLYLKVDDQQLEKIEQQVNAEFTREGNISGMSESLKLVVALQNLDREFALDAGAINCHVPELRYGDDPGVTPCFALGCETTRGIPWVCSGDVVTAIAMLVAKRVSGAAFYHEIEGFDANTGELGLANSGEHDLCWCQKIDQPYLQKNSWYVKDVKTGAAANFALRDGPATLVSFTPNGAEPSGFRFVVAEGYVTDRLFPAKPSVGGAFKFNAEDVVSTWSQWAMAGVNHHSALASGHIADDVAVIARFLKIGCVKVC
jgi:L-arabinose isomerase